MSLFGKDYDAQINQLNETITFLLKSQKTLQDYVLTLQDDFINLGKIQAQNKMMLVFLMNHASVDSDAQEDLGKMMQDIVRIEKEVKESLEKAKNVK